MLSVIVTIYNIEKYIRQCIESILNQTFKDIEIILVNDGSTDSSGRICDEYALNDTRIVVFHQENGGLVSARKAGLKMAKGEYITYVDGDDWVDPSTYGNMYQKIKLENADIVFYGHYENTGESQKEVFHGIDPGTYDKKMLIEQVYPHMIAGNHFFEWRVFPSLWDMIIKKELLEKSQYGIDEEIDIGEDAACIYPCLLLAERVCFVREAFYHYRQIPESMIKQIKDCDIERRKLLKLYKTVDLHLSQITDEFDIHKQWISYMMFVMLPRADTLLKDYNQLPFLFPYNNVKRGCRIAIYGAGTYGQRLYYYIKQTQYCEIVAWFDKNYRDISKNGCFVQSPDEIILYDFDMIIIANMFYSSRKEIASFILSKKNCTICEINEDIVFSSFYLKMFGLE